MVVAETMEAARDGVELVDVAYEPLSAATDVQSSLNGAALVWETRPDNLCIDGDVGEPLAKRLQLALESRLHHAGAAVRHSPSEIA